MNIKDDQKRHFPFCLFWILPSISRITSVELKEGKKEMQNFEYLENNKSFLDAIKTILHNFQGFSESAACFKRKKIVDATFNNVSSEHAWKFRYCQFVNVQNDKEEQHIFLKMKFASP